MTTSTPYRIESHPVTGTTNGKLATWLFLASEVMLFGALFSAYLMLKIGAGENWQSGRLYLSAFAGVANTLLILFSVVAIALGVKSLKKENFRRFMVCQGLAFVFSIAFLSIGGWQYQKLFSMNQFPHTNNFWGLYFTFTGLYAFHLISGVFSSGMILLVRGRSDRNLPGATLRRSECAALYWYFLAILWVVLFFTWYFG